MSTSAENIHVFHSFLRDNLDLDLLNRGWVTSMQTVFIPFNPAITADTFKHTRRTET